MVAAAVMQNPPTPIYRDLAGLPNPGIETLVSLADIHQSINTTLDSLGLSNLKGTPLHELENKILTAVDKRLIDAQTKIKNGGPSEGPTERGGKKTPVKEKINEEKSETHKGDS